MSNSATAWMKLTEAAEYARVSVPTPRRAIKAGRLEAVKVNGEWEIQLPASFHDSNPAWAKLGKDNVNPLPLEETDVG